ncbi:MAG: hypothetical protein LBU03_03770 [Tannerellaceae bacterium]|jgi:hypothetical protein|nr:hypothetical protein [Tannerellaceae bacterium]
MRTSYENIKDELFPLCQTLKVRNIPFVVPVEEFAFADTLFFDTHYHLNDRGIRIRTQKTIDILNKLLPSVQEK